MTVEVFDHRVCILGEGALWHPQRNQLFWFDILGRRLLTRDGQGVPHAWDFAEHVSAAGWVDPDRLLVASESALLLFDLREGSSEIVAALEADRPHTRSNDGRADPWGGFWIGTMGKSAEPGEGALYRWYKGRLRRLRAGLTIPNAISFSPDGHVYFADTATGSLYRQALNAEGWPEGEAALFLDLAAEGINPDGAVVDAEGCLWNAQWGAGRVARYAPDGTFLAAYEVPAAQTSCPAFGGASCDTLFVTSAAENDETEGAGRTWRIDGLTVCGRPEPRVVLAGDA
ncbi:SMP-30/gluconolactonase/LRE family protein [Telmatospirillum sp. J64-1]|uniref:SMP-30/gluconolactonase/LRE family protein n=1 Tax=Telmatospirillum sp. J64-1 TaxID=2502183 RepID=UPI00115C6D1D|nr:SMP-30/gluconolactonase/LRE family protein [Telmatospirillum sp. J64-1]